MCRAFTLLFCLFVSFFSEVEAAETKTVAITQIAAHPSLDKIRQGVIDALAQAGFKEGQNLELSYDNAQGNPTTAAQIAQKIAAVRPDVAVAITTPSAQAAYKVLKPQGVPVIFAGVSDPVAAKLVQDLDHPGAGITGSVDRLDAAAQLAEILKMKTDLKRLGVIYSAGEANSVAYLKELKHAAQSLGLEVVEASLSKTAEVSQVTLSLVGRVDAVLIPTDNTVVSALESVLKVAKARQLPVFVSDPDSFERGADAAVFLDQYAIGVAAGQLVAKILSGQKIETLAPVILKEMKVKSRS
ncbi:MAG: ABC transporter substrate-binding protein [Holosporales bacterium]